MNEKRKVSIEDVAQRAGVSITTVSRVINKVPTVSAKNQAKVEEAIAYFKYKPDVSAQRLARGQNNTIGLVMPGYPGIFHSYYAIELIRGVGHACETFRQDLVFHIANRDNQLSTSSVGGVIFADIIENKQHVIDAVEAGVPCMVINNIVEGMDVNYIGVDNVEGGKIAIDYLEGLGHKKIAIITGNLQTQAGKQRCDGALEMLKSKGIEIPPEYIIQGDYSRRSARLAAEKLFSLASPPTAVFAASDDMALETIAYVVEKGLKVPDDVSVVGFDDNPAAIYGPVALTTIRQPLFQIAEESVRILNAIVSGKKKGPVRKVVIPELIVRDSCKSL